MDRKEPALGYLKKHKPQGSRLLDVGCGNGRFLAHIQDYYNCLGIDASEAGIKQAKKKAPQAEVKTMSVAQMSRLKTHSFDIVTAFDIAEHLESYDELLTQVTRVLKPDGSLHSRSRILKV